MADAVVNPCALCGALVNKGRETDHATFHATITALTSSVLQLWVTNGQLTAAVTEVVRMLKTQPAPAAGPPQLSVVPTA